jgi:hypothetical protein
MSDQMTYWKVLRTKIGTTDDPDWQGTQVLPTSITALVGGTASNGDYVLTIEGALIRPNGTRIPVSEDITATRNAAETSAQMAAELEVAAEANATLERLGFDFTVSSATVTIIAPAGFVGTVSRTVPGTATITFPLGPDIAALASAPVFAGGRNELGAVVVSVMACDDEGDTPLLPNAYTFDITLIEVALYRDPSGVLRFRVQEGETQTDCLLDTEYSLALRGAFYWTVRLLTNADVANVPAGTDSFRVLWRDAGVS